MFGLSFAGLTSTLVFALHVGSEICWLALMLCLGSHTLELWRIRRFQFSQQTTSITQQKAWEAEVWDTALEKSGDTTATLMPDVRQERHGVLGMANKNVALAGILATSFAAIAATALSQSSNRLRFCHGLAHTMLETTCFCMLLTF